VTGVIGVVEQVDLIDARVTLLTTIDASGAIASVFLRPPKTDLKDLTVRILQKLNQWYSRRPGDPFKFDAWRMFENWVIREIGKHVPAESHLVIIDHADWSGLPWHVAAARRWSTSYISSWNALLTLAGPPCPDLQKSARLGIACVPSFDDGPQVVAALFGSSKRTEAFATGAGVAFEVALEAGCGQDELRQLLQACDVVKLLCHGYVSPEEREVAVMIAVDQSLPPRLAQAAETKQGRAHRFSWRHVEELARTPRLVVSGACSSSRAHIAGQGERL